MHVSALFTLELLWKLCMHMREAMQMQMVDM